jgi:hypothetical protein
VIDSLFGSAAPPRLPPSRADADDAAPLRQDVLVDPSSLRSLRQHLARRVDRPQADGPANARPGRNITLLDPTGLAASAVLQAVSRASGQPVQQLHLRDRHTLRTLAVVSRTTLWRSGEPLFQVLSTQLREPGHLAQAFSLALAEAADLAVVFTGHLPAPAMAAQQRALLACSHRAGWRCRTLLFVLPASRRAAAADLLRAAWPAALSVQTLVDLDGQAIGLWNQIVAHWRQSESPTPVAADRRSAASSPGWSDTRPEIWRDVARRSAANQALASPADGRTSAAIGEPEPQPRATTTDPFRPLLARLAGTEGLLACALVDMAHGRTLAVAHHPGQGDPVDGPTLARLAQALCAARDAHAAVGAAATADEVLITVGGRQALLRRLPGPASLGFMALADRARVNLALLRFSLLALEKLAL